MTGPDTWRGRWRSGERTHVEVRGVHQPGTERAAADLEARLLEVPGVRAAEVNSVFGRVAVSHEPDVPVGELTTAISEIERLWQLRGRTPAGARHPANPGPAVRELLAIGINLAGFSYSVAGRLLPLPSLPPVVPALLSLVDSTPRLRAPVERALGGPATDALFAVGGSLGHSLARRPVTLVADTVYRLCLHREITARRRAWHEWEGRPQRAAPLVPVQRAAPLPYGPVERVATASAALGLAGSAASLALTRDPRRTTAIVLAGVPRPAKTCRETFAAHLGTHLCGSGALVLEPEALRRLDRVDTVVLHHDILRTGRRVVDELLASVPDLPAAVVLRHAHDLVGTPRKGKRGTDWSLASPGDVSLPGTLAGAAAGTAVVVLRRGRPVGVVSVIAEREPLAEAVEHAAGEAGTVVHADSGLTATVRHLQAEGHVVAVVSAGARRALHVADVGIGVHGPGRDPPWDADVLCGSLAQACALLRAVGFARRASRHGTALAISASALGALFGTLGPAGTAASRAAFPGNFATLLAVGAGTWAGMEASRLPAPVPQDSTPWHAMSRRAVLRRLDSGRQGLAERESARRRQAEPAGDQGTDPGDSGLVVAAAEELSGPLTPALAAGAGVSASLGSVTDAVLITGVLAVNALIGGAQRVAAQRELRRLLDTSALRVSLRRPDSTRPERVELLAPGDVLELAAGDAVPADCRLLEARSLEVDESSLTGESQPVAKTARPSAARAIADRTSMLYRGTVVVAGSAVAVVVATGARTEAERAVRGDGERAPVTGVAARLAELTRTTLPATIGAGTGLLLVDLLRRRGFTRSLGRAVSLSVAAVPEGLPFVATVAELASARRLASRGVLVRSPSTIEALGRVDVLCFDKTGTLTEGRIRLRAVSDGTRTLPLSELTPELTDVLAVAVRAGPWRDGDAALHAADTAVQAAAEELGVGAEHGLGGLDWLDELGFEPSRGYHAVLSAALDGSVLSVKGAPEAVLRACTRLPAGRGPLDDDARAAIEAEVSRLASHGYRVLAVAERRASSAPELLTARVRELEFRGLLALADPVRPTAAAAVAELRTAGVDVVMLTGDHPGTAEAIATELGLGDGGRVLTGAEVDDTGDDELAARLRDVAVVARVSPAQKARIVRALHRAGRVVAMTGDGTNDAPAIRLAHVGIAVGAKATAAAKESSDLLITDDRIETITDALVEGRAMWASVRDALAILLGGNLGEVAFTVVAGLLSTRDALNARQLLLVNLLTDVLPAMAVAVRPPPGVEARELLEEGPDASLGGVLTREVTVRAVTTAASALAAWLLARPVSTGNQAATTGLVALVGAQLGQTMAVRGRTPLVLAAGVGSLAVLVTVVQVPGMSRFFGCSPLLPHQWGVGLGASAAAMAAEWLRHRT
ncbi:cation-translocating P-type ATPase [Prauserella sp. ASG 168]|uniref:Cation-translocating P-type ATPase n=2 Tax=Prauserella cavernicola TaxID=2800127 RepID=A0A934V2V4_9PSEU|nr:cation-translocating P-type ATPase [Prauserella cavernicola]